MAVTYEQQGDSSQEVEYVELALDEQLPGRYSLKVSINDKNSGESAEKDVVFVISPDRLPCVPKYCEKTFPPSLM